MAKELKYGLTPAEVKQRAGGGQQDAPIGRERAGHEDEGDGGDAVLQQGGPGWTPGGTGYHQVHQAMSTPVFDMGFGRRPLPSDSRVQGELARDRP